MTALSKAPPARLSVFMRRFCCCGRCNVCHCGLPRPTSGWTVERLTRLRAEMALHNDLTIVAELLGETRHGCNLALDALLGATPTHALARLEAARERAAA